MNIQPILAQAQTRGSAHSTEWTRFSWSGIVLWNCDSPGWKSDNPMSTRSGEPQTGLSCLSWNILHSNWQSRATGPVMLYVVWWGKVAVTRLFKPKFLRAAPARGKRVWVRMWAKARGRNYPCRPCCLLTMKKVYLSVSTMHGGSESQS